LRLQTLVEAHEEAPGQTLEQTLTERENARSSECFGRREEKRAPQESMPQPSSPDDRSDNSTNERNKEERSDNPSRPSEDDFEPYPDLPGTDHEPRMTQKGKTIFPRKLWGLLRDKEVNARELLGLVFVLDQTDGWRVLRRTWVRLTNEDWAEALGMSSRNARRIRDSLLEKNLIRRRREGNSYLYQIRLPERDEERKRVRREARRILGIDDN
jgi:DNA-binding transcriptional ArsR family regulator